MQDGPSSSEMLTAIISLLSERIMPKIDGHDSYALLVAINSLKTVQREVDNRQTFEAEELERLRNLLGEDGDIDTLNKKLCEKIRDRDFTLEDKSVLEHLKRTTIDQVRLDQPRYSGLTYALEQDECQTKAQPHP